MTNATDDRAVPAPVQQITGLKIIFKNPYNGDHYCDGMLSWDDICEALEPAVKAGVITIHHLVGQLLNEDK